MCVRACVCMYVCMYVCFHVCIWVYTYIFTCMYIHVRGPGVGRRVQARVALQAFSDLLSRSAHPRRQAAPTFTLAGAPSAAHRARALVRSRRRNSARRACAHPPTSWARACVRAVCALSYLANFLSVLVVSTIATASIAFLLFSKPRGRTRRTRHTDRLCFEALCLVCAPPVSTQNTGGEHSGHPVQGAQFEYSG